MTDFFNTGLTQQQFLDQYWQKQPLLIRNAFSSLPNFSAEELAALACEDDVESRIIEEFGDTQPWQLRYGPFSETDFADLDESHWTLLVQDVDKHVPELAAFFDPFRFIPDWRRDDLMVSYAPVGGSVGPHTDGYDVFLLQTMGTRRWQISSRPIENPAFIDGLSLKILAQFEADQSWDLQPGDMLYLPPHFAHHGVAQNDCMTFSIGFRAPSQLELLDTFIQTLSEQEKGEQRYADPDLRIHDDEYQIDATAVARFKHSLLQCIEQNDEMLTQAIGSLLTQTKPSLELFAEESGSEAVSQSSIEQHFNSGDALLRNPYYRFAWSAEINKPTLFVGGQSYPLSVASVPFIPLLCDKQPITQQHWLRLSPQQELVELLIELISIGAWYWQTELD